MDSDTVYLNGRKLFGMGLMRARNWAIFLHPITMLSLDLVLILCFVLFQWSDHGFVEGCYTRVFEMQGRTHNLALPTGCSQSHFASAQFQQRLQSVRESVEAWGEAEQRGRRD